MTVLLNRTYFNSPAGSVVEFPKSTEDSLIAQGFATASALAPTVGAQTASGMRGAAAIAAGQSSVVVTSPYVDETSTVVAYVAQAAADTTLLRVERVVPANGNFTIFGTANATATTTLNWVVINNQPIVTN